jgi:hypothetical protein
LLKNFRRPENPLQGGGGRDAGPHRDTTRSATGTRNLR